MEKESQVYIKALKVMFRWGCDLVIEYLLSIYSIYPKFDLYHYKIKILQKFSDEKCLNLYYKFKLNTLFGCNDEP